MSMLSKALLIAMLAGGTAASPARAVDLYDHPGAIASAELKPASGYEARGLVQIGGRKGAQPRGVLVALLLPAVEKIEIALSAEPCGSAIADGTSNTVPLGEASVRDDRSAVARLQGFTPRQLRRARSLVIATSDVQAVVACGDLRKSRTVSPREANRVAIGANRLSGPVRLSLLGVTWDPNLLTGTAVVTGLEPGARYRLGFASRAKRGARLPPRISFTADDRGSAYLVIRFEDVLVSSLKRLRAVTIGRLAAGGRGERVATIRIDILGI